MCATSLPLPKPEKVSAAAAGLNVRQSAVTAPIKALETELERKLFERRDAHIRRRQLHCGRIIPAATSIALLASVTERIPDRILGVLTQTAFY